MLVLGDRPEVVVNPSFDALDRERMLRALIDAGDALLAMAGDIVRQIEAEQERPDGGVAHEGLARPGGAGAA
jgi:hypothetical protein